MDCLVHFRGFKIPPLSTPLAALVYVNHVERRLDPVVCCNPGMVLGTIALATKAQIHNAYLLSICGVENSLPQTLS